MRRLLHLHQHRIVTMNAEDCRRLGGEGAQMLLLLMLMLLVLLLMVMWKVRVLQRMLLRMGMNNIRVTLMNMLLRGLLLLLLLMDSTEATQAGSRARGHLMSWITGIAIGRHCPATQQ